MGRTDQVFTFYLDLLHPSLTDLLWTNGLQARGHCCADELQLALDLWTRIWWTGTFSGLETSGSVATVLADQTFLSQMIQHQTRTKPAVVVSSFTQLQRTSTSSTHSVDHVNLPLFQLTNANKSASFRCFLFTSWKFSQISMVFCSVPRPPLPVSG